MAKFRDILRQSDEAYRLQELGVAHEHVEVEKPCSLLIFRPPKEIPFLIVQLRPQIGVVSEFEAETKQKALETLV